MTTDPKSGTPRTDAQQEAEDRFDGAVTAEFARTIERELSRCREELAEEKYRGDHLSAKVRELVQLRLASHAERPSSSTVRYEYAGYAPSAASGLAYPYSAAGVADRLETHLREAPFNDDGTQRFNTATAATMREAITLLRSHQAPVGEGRPGEAMSADMPASTLRERTVLEILDEVDRARKKHPDWPDNVIEQAAIVCEESGELIRAALQYKYESGTANECDKKAIQTAAMCIRFLEDS
jgi:hypothetical protein